MKKASLIFNPSCSKCRGADEILREKKLAFEPIFYLKGGLSKDLLQSLPALLGIPYEQMIRTKEELYEELKLGEKKLSSEEWIELLLKHPILLERPIFIYGDKAIIARPSELVLKLL